MKQDIATIKERENGELYLEFPNELMDEMGWCEGDTLEWKDNRDGSWTIQKVSSDEHNSSED